MARRFCPACAEPVRDEDVRCRSCGMSLSEEDTTPAAFNPKPYLDAREDEFAPAATIDPLPVIDASLLAPVPVVVTDPPVAPSDRKGSETLSTKKAHRAAVRRARMQGSATPECTEVLVLDPDDHTSRPLCSLLAAFGFTIIAAPDVVQAAAIARRRHLAAAFADVPLDDPDDPTATELCQALKAALRAPDGRPTAVFIIGTGLSPVARIRAQLAGADAVIDKPASRGDVARALESCNVVLPSDARRL